MYNPLSLEIAKDYAKHQSRPRGARILTSLMTVQEKLLFLASRGTDSTKCNVGLAAISSLPSGKTRTCVSSPWQTKIYVPFLPTKHFKSGAN